MVIIPDNTSNVVDMDPFLKVVLLILYALNESRNVLDIPALEYVAEKSASISAVKSPISSIFAVHVIVRIISPDVCVTRAPILDINGSPEGNLTFNSILPMGL